MPRELHCAADTWRSLCDSRQRLATWIGDVGVEIRDENPGLLRVRIPPDPIQPRRCVAVGILQPPVVEWRRGVSSEWKGE